MRSRAMSQSDGTVTRLLLELRGGDRSVFDEMLPLVYDELCRLARFQLRHEKVGTTLQTTDLVHEAYFKLVNHHQVDWEDRSHFFSVAARAMRQVLVDRARKRNAEKRGGGMRKLDMEADRLGAPEQDEAILALEEALQRLEKLDERQGQVVECRFFAGLTIEEAAAALDVSASTVKRDWRAAKAWLYREMRVMMG